MENIAAIVLYSTVVSSLVTLLLRNFLENKKYIKDKKFFLYSEYIEQLGKLFSDDLIKDPSSFDSILRHYSLEAAKLEKSFWQIKLVSNNKELISYANQLFILHCETSKKAETKSIDVETLFMRMKEAEMFQDKLILAMQKDINKFL